MDTGTELLDDAALLAATRAGDADAFAVLYLRHVDAARRLAARLAGDTGAAEDLVSEAFARVLAAVQRGGGPAASFRAYLNTALRNGFYTDRRRDRRLEFTDDLSAYEVVTGVPDPAVLELERRSAARAFARLPERWRMVLWHTAVEGETPAQLAPRLGLSPGGVAALAFRARARLRQMYHQEHAVGTLPR
ncbi:MAG: sigma-70 family RNA polymerase sigma factor [Actinobacteria bacterium]|nr:MAG: sigma-70 family RNA polymerase sigma factor [Actinomycetota bacterium]